MKHFLGLVLALVVMLPACNVGCEVEQVISGGLATKIASLRNCKNVPQIQSDIQTILNHVNVCTLPAVQHKTGAVATIVCPILATTAVGYVDAKIPANWECDAAPGADASTVALLTTACELLPF